MESTIELTKALAWPLVILFGCLIFRKEISAVAKDAPSLFRRTSEIKVGPVKLAIEKQAMTAGHPEIMTALKGIGARELEHFMRLEDSISWRGVVGHGSDLEGREFYSLPSQQKIEILQRLEKRGLVRFSQGSLAEFLDFAVNLDHVIRQEPHSCVEINAEGLSSKETEKLTGERYAITTLGASAKMIIFDTIAKDLSAG